VILQTTGALALHPILSLLSQTTWSRKDKLLGLASIAPLVKANTQLILTSLKLVVMIKLITRKRR
jgi:hypothetical protein